MARHVIDYEKLIAFAAEEVDGETAAVIAAHIAGCSSCAKTVALFRAIRALFRADNFRTPSADLVSRVCALFSASLG